MDRVVGIGECIVSNDPGDVIKTYALASCVAVTVYSREKKVAGMVHIALPERMRSFDDSYEKPCYYATLAVPFLMNKIC
ncbi:MAG: chemotaxis protein CheD, partial [Clostridiales bacterium]|nr:chemotaxis protein CheD [Clostridiales bacterium]